jgi:16S rRNA (guanine966-N2)-methyltransferase
MRVVAGRLGGRRIEPPRGRDTRPTSERVREALFSILGPAVEGACVLDLYAGSGALGIEALSRGAASATFVDSAPRAVAAVRRNLESLGLEAAVERVSVASYLKRASARFDLVFLDPPYSSASREAKELSNRLAAVLSTDYVIVTESDKRAPLELDFPLADERVYGDTRIAIHR